jgi:endonuclease/exonuclease/phosphatase family metal-dependent hydrolase
LALAVAVAIVAYKAWHHAEGRFTHFVVRAPRNPVVGRPGLRILTANVQRLPYIPGRPPVDVGRMLRDHDLVCLQEDFQPWQTARASRAAGTPLVSFSFPGGTWRTVLNSGLSVWSRYPVRRLAFERFTNLRSVDQLADKGFLAVSVGGLIVVNTHLQATYDYRDLHYDVAQQQVQQILAWLRHHHRHRPAVVVGDFNFDLPAARAARRPGPAAGHGHLLIGARRIRRSAPPEYIFPAEPTTWSRMDSVFETSSPVHRHGFLPMVCDGAVYEPSQPDRVSVDPSSVRTHRYDPHTDHLAVSFTVRIRSD